MMDVGMYGNEHVPHTTGYQSPDVASNGYSYYQNHHHHLHHNHHLNAEPILAYATQNIAVTPNTTSPTSTSTSSNSSAMYHAHLYSPSAAEYGITTSNHSPTEHHSYFESDTAAVAAASVHPFYNAQTSHGAGEPQVAGIPETHIISSDNGLSYTNLDHGHTIFTDWKSNQQQKRGDHECQSPYMYNHGHHHTNGAASMRGQADLLPACGWSPPRMRAVSQADLLHEDDKSAVSHLTYSNAAATVAAAAVNEGGAWHPHHHSNHHQATGFLDGNSGGIPPGHQGKGWQLANQQEVSSKIFLFN